MKHWNIQKRKYLENKKIDAYIEEVLAVSRKHGLSISHEDSQGAFIVEEFSKANADWLLAAHDATYQRSES